MNKLDVFTGFNLLLFLAMCVLRYHARFIEYRGIEHIHEFFVYAALIIVGILALWRVFRRHAFDGALLVWIQVGILMHFSGAFVQIDGGRLYDQVLWSVRYDKLVHFVNAFAAAWLLQRLLQWHGLDGSRSRAFRAVMVVLGVQGLGAVVEIAEYFVVLTVPRNGVGDYDNNMQDLIANLAGACTCLLVGLRRQRTTS